jgi:hypothetical protein
VAIQSAGELSNAASVLQLGLQDSDTAFVEDIGRCLGTFLGLDDFVEETIDASRWDVC